MKAEYLIQPQGGADRERAPQAFRTFQVSDMDALVVDNWVVLK